MPSLYSLLSSEFFLHLFFSFVTAFLILLDGKKKGRLYISGNKLLSASGGFLSLADKNGFWLAHSSPLLLVALLSLSPTTRNSFSRSLSLPASCTTRDTHFPFCVAKLQAMTSCNTSSLHTLLSLALLLSVEGGIGVKTGPEMS